MAYNPLNPTLESTSEFIGTYAKSYIDVHSLAAASDEPTFKTQIYPQLMQNMGGGTKMFDILRATGREMFVQGRRLVGFEQPRENTFVTLATALESDSTGYGAGDTIYFKISSNDYNSNGQSGLRLHFYVLVPGKYYGMDRPVPYQVIAKSTSGTVGGLSAGTGANTVYTCKPSSDVHDLATDVPIGEKLLVAYSGFGTGAGQPESMTDAYLQKSFYTHIVKETMEIEGGANAHERIAVVSVNGGQQRLFDKGMMETERRLDRQMDMAVLFSEENDNSITATNTPSGSATTILTTKGLMPIIDDLGQEMVLNSTWNALEDWDALKTLRLSQGTTANASIVYCGNSLYTQIENNLLDEMVDRSDALYDKELQTLGVPFKKVNKGGHLYYLVELDALSNPIGYGLSGYELSNQGIVVPLGEVAGRIEGDPTRYRGGNLDMGRKMMLPNMAIAYLRGFGEDRRSIVNIVSGPNGSGYPASHQYDVTNAYLIREFMFFLMKANELIWIHKSNA